VTRCSPRSSGRQSRDAAVRLSRAGGARTSRSIRLVGVRPGKLSPLAKVREADGPGCRSASKLSRSGAKPSGGRMPPDRSGANAFCGLQKPLSGAGCGIGGGFIVFSNGLTICNCNRLPSNIILTPRRADLSLEPAKSGYNRVNWAMSLIFGQKQSSSGKYIVIRRITEFSGNSQRLTGFYRQIREQTIFFGGSACFPGKHDAAPWGRARRGTAATMAGGGRLPFIPVHRKRSSRTWGA
jgi:hypothetical protein